MFININSKYHQRMYALKIVRFKEKKKTRTTTNGTETQKLYHQITLPYQIVM